MNIKANVVLVKNQKVKGSATVVLDDCFKIRDIVILAKNGTGELFVAMPYKVLKNGNKVGRCIFKETRFCFRCRSCSCPIYRR